MKALIRRAVLLLHIASLMCLCSTACFADAPATQPAPIPRGAMDAAIARGVKFLEASQTAEGCWGTGTVSSGNEIASMVPGSHDAFRLGTTALCVMALREVGEHSAHDRGVQYLLHASDALRDDGALIYNTWANIYVTQAMAEELLHSSQRDPRVVEVAERNIRLLIAYATYEGGWNYYDFGAQTEHVSMGPTSFGTAAGLVALHEAREAKLEVPQRLIDTSLHRLEEMRLSDEDFLYGSDYKYMPLLPANRSRGAVGRTQPAHYAIRLWDPDKATVPQVVAGLDAFFADHDFLEMGRKRPYPHESWYQTSGYYYYFDHYYAARLLADLPEAMRPHYAAMLAEVVLPHQEDDGSWWDYAMWDYHKPYGTAFAIMTLLRCRTAM
jgi:hypothetical protein